MMKKTIFKLIDNRIFSLIVCFSLLMNFGFSQALNISTGIANPTGGATGGNSNWTITAADPAVLTATGTTLAQLPKVAPSLNLNFVTTQYPWVAPPAPTGGAVQAHYISIVNQYDGFPINTGNINNNEVTFQRTFNVTTAGVYNLFFEAAVDDVITGIRIFQLNNGLTIANIGAPGSTGNSNPLAYSVLSNVASVQLNLQATNYAFEIIAANEDYSGAQHTNPFGLLIFGSISAANNVNLCKGNTNQLNPTLGTNGVWTSSNPDVVTVNNTGLVTAVNDGTAQVTYMIGNGSLADNNSFAVNYTVNTIPSVTTIQPNTPVNICVGADVTLSNATSSGVWSTQNLSVASVNTNGVVTGNAVGAATIEYTVSQGACSKTVTKDVTVVSAPVITNSVFIGIPSTLCLGGSFGLGLPNPNSVWSVSPQGVATITGGGVNGVGLGTATIKYSETNSNGCSASISTDFFVYPNPTVSILPGNTNLCLPNGSITLQASYSLAASFQWYLNGTQIPNATGNSYTVTSINGGLLGDVYTVQVVSPNGCITLSNSVLITSTTLPDISITGASSVCEGATTQLSLQQSFNGVSGSWGATPNTPIVIATVDNNGLVTGVNAGDVDIYYNYSFHGCSGSAHYDFTVNALPSVPTITTSIASGIIPCNGSITLTSSSSTGNQWYKDGVLITNATSSTYIATLGGVYTVVVTQKFGCSATSLPITLTAITPVIAPITGPSQVCVGSTITLSNATAGGVWSSTNDRGAVNASGVYTGSNAGTWGQVKYTVTNTTVAPVCTAFKTYAITVNAIPNVPYIGYAPGTQNPQVGAPTGSFCVGKQFDIVGYYTWPNFLSGIWSATGAVSITSTGHVTVNSVGAGMIKFTFIDANGCSNSRQMVGNGFYCARGVNITPSNPEKNTAITLYPNPAKLSVNVQIDKLVGEGQIVITDLLGKKLKMQPLIMGSNKIDISSLAKGFYLVSIITNEVKSTQKLIVE